MDGAAGRRPHEHRGHGHLLCHGKVDFPLLHVQEECVSEGISKT